jgi:hypothetical protein
MIDGALEIVSTQINGGTEDESAAYDCSAHPETPRAVGFGAEGADCQG